MFENPVEKLEKEFRICPVFDCFFRDIGVFNREAFFFIDRPGAQVVIDRQVKGGNIGPVIGQVFL